MIFKNYCRATLLFVFTCFSVQPQAAAWDVQSFFNDNSGKLALGCAGGVLVGGVSWYALHKLIFAEKKILAEIENSEPSEMNTIDDKKLAMWIARLEKAEKMLLFGTGLCTVAGILCALKFYFSKGASLVPMESQDLHKKKSAGDGDDGKDGGGGTKRETIGTDDLLRELNAHNRFVECSG